MEVRESLGVSRRCDRGNPHGRRRRESADAPGGSWLGHTIHNSTDHANPRRIIFLQIICGNVSAGLSVKE